MRKGGVESDPQIPKPSSASLSPFTPQELSIRRSVNKRNAEARWSLVIAHGCPLFLSDHTSTFLFASQRATDNFPPINQFRSRTYTDTGRPWEENCPTSAKSSKQQTKQPVGKKEEGEKNKFFVLVFRGQIFARSKPRTYRINSTNRLFAWRLPEATYLNIHVSSTS